MSARYAEQVARNVIKKAGMSNKWGIVTWQDKGWHYRLVFGPFSIIEVPVNGVLQFLCRIIPDPPPDSEKLDPVPRAWEDKDTTKWKVYDSPIEAYQSEAKRVLDFLAEQERAIRYVETQTMFALTELSPGRCNADKTDSAGLPEVQKEGN